MKVRPVTGPTKMAIRTLPSSKSYPVPSKGLSSLFFTLRLILIYMLAILHTQAAIEKMASQVMIGTI